MAKKRLLGREGDNTIRVIWDAKHSPDKDGLKTLRARGFVDEPAELKDVPTDAIGWEDGEPVNLDTDEQKRDRIKALRRALILKEMPMHEQLEMIMDTFAYLQLNGVDIPADVSSFNGKRNSIKVQNPYPGEE